METTKYLPWFESSVNSEGIETRKCLTRPAKSFESSVNSEGIETRRIKEYQHHAFESSVNSEGIETFLFLFVLTTCLRAV